MNQQDVPRFALAVFDVTGELVGRVPFDTSQLSADWSNLSASLLATQGSAFATNLIGAEAHLGLRFTSSAGAAVATFHAHERLVVSVLLLSGRSTETEAELVELFHNSISAAAEKLLGGPPPAGFSALRSLTDRPLAFIVAWGAEGVAEKDEDLLRDLSLHIAATFFARELR
jgi:hypothetical protein